MHLIDQARKTALDLDLCESNLRSFLNSVFDAVAKEHDLDGSQFQKRAKLTGDAFEICFQVIMEKFYPDITLAPNVPIPEACMERGGEADFAIFSEGTTKGDPRRLATVFEAKGSADRVIGRDGNPIEFKRPGMMRTDTVKKAISSAYQIHRTHPEALFFIVTSHKPTKGNAKCMCRLAEGDIVDKIVDVTSKEELDEMVEMIRERLKTG